MKIADRHRQKPSLSAEFPDRLPCAGKLRAVYIMNKQNTARGKPVPEERQRGCRRGIEICVDGDKSENLFAAVAEGFREISSVKYRPLPVGKALFDRILRRLRKVANLGA